MTKKAAIVLFTAFVVLLFNSGARFSIGLILHPMTTDLGWSRATLSSAVTVFLIISASALPFTGRLVDKFGARLVLATGVIVCAVALTLMSVIQSPLQAMLLYGVVFALGSAAMSITPIGVILTQWFPDRVGMANSIAISGMGVGQLLIISVLASQLLVLGWRGSFLLLGIATLLCVLPLVVISGRSQPRRDAIPDDQTHVREAGTGPSETNARSLTEVLRVRRFWILLAMYAVCGFQDFLFATHVVAFALDQGVGPLFAGNMLAFMGLTGLMGVLITGSLNDRYGPVVPTAICFVIRIAVFAVILISQLEWVILTAALLFGFTFWITAPLTVVYARALCGISTLGVVSGLITMVHHSAGGLGALAGGLGFEIYGSYYYIFVLLLALSIAALGLTLLLKERNVNVEA